MSLIYPPVPTSPARTSLAPDTPSPLEDTHQADGGDGGDAGAAAAVLEKAQVPPHLNITVRRRTPAVKTPGTTPESPLVAFVARAEKVLEHEARDALLTPPGSRAGSVVGDDDSDDNSYDEDDAGSERLLSPILRKESMSLSGVDGDISGGKDGEGYGGEGHERPPMLPQPSSLAALSHADATAADAEAAAESPLSKLSMGAAYNSMLAMTDQIVERLVVGSKPGTSMALHELDGSHALRLTHQLRSLYRSSALCDFAVLCSGRRLDFHRVVLHCGSGYFHDIVEADPSLSVHELEFDPPISPDTFERIAESLYTGAVGSMDYSGSLQLLKAAYFLRIPFVTEQCTGFLLDVLSQDNCLEVWLAANFCSNSDLHKASTAMVGRHLGDVSTCSLFLGLESNDLIDLLSDDGLELGTEAAAYAAAMDWIRHDPSHREGLLTAVLGTVRFPYLSSPYLTDTVAKERLIVTNHDAMLMYSSALRYKLAGKKLFEGEAEPGDMASKPKRRDNIMNEIRGNYERYQKESENGTLERRIDEVKARLFHLLHDRILMNKYVLFWRDEIIVKRLIEPVRRNPCRPASAETLDQEYTRDLMEELNGDSNALADSGGLSTPQNDSFFVRYIARPIANTPCIPPDSDIDDDSIYNPAYEEGSDDTPTNLDPRLEMDPALKHVLTPSVWTKIDVKFRTPSSAQK